MGLGTRTPRSSVIALALAIASNAGSTRAQDEPLPPIPRKTLPAADLAERVLYFHELAAALARWEAEHRIQAREMRARFIAESQEAARNKAFVSDRWYKEQAERENAAADALAQLKRQYQHLQAHPDEPPPPHFPPLPGSRERARDCAVIAAANDDVAALYREGSPRGERTEWILAAYSLFDTTPADFTGLLAGAKLADGLTGQLEQSIALRNSGGPTTFLGLTFHDPTPAIRDLSVVDSETGMRLDEMPRGALPEHFPLYVPTIETYLPGYSADAQTAAIRLLVGPPAVPHGPGRYSATLKLSERKWRVTWRTLDWPE